MNAKKIIAFCVAIVFLFLFVISIDPSIDWTDDKLKLIANVLPVVSALGLIVGFTRRFLLSTLLTIAFCLLLFNIHTLKLEHLDQPLKFADSFLIWQTLNNWNLLSLYAPKWLAPISIVSIVLVSWFFYIEKPMCFRLSIPIGFIALTSLLALGFESYSPATLYGPYAHGAKPWESNDIAKKQGLIASLASGARSARFALPEYDQSLIDDFLLNQSNVPTDNKAQMRPDIIFWLAESFFDPGIIEEVETCGYLPTFCNLRNNSLQSSLQVPTFGGNTTRTEFEVLTGVPFMSLGTENYPYLSVVHDKISSIPWSLKSLGYQNTVIHPNRDGMWQRDRAMPLLGFDDFISRKHFIRPETDGVWPSDAELSRRVIQELQSDEVPQFILAISMEGHGPFPKRNVLDTQRRDSIEPPFAMSDKSVTEWREYIYHAENASKAISELKHFVEQRKRPTLVVFFGDHLPSLPNVFREVKFSNGQSAPQQKTPAFAFSNYPMKVEWVPKASHELGVWALELAGLVMRTNFKDLDRALQTRQQKGESKELSDVLRALQIKGLYRSVDD